MCVVILGSITVGMHAYIASFGYVSLYIHAYILFHMCMYLYVCVHMYIISFERLLSRIETPTTTVSAVNSTSTSGCVKCGTIAKSGKLSCCARGASWFNNCGDVGDAHFDHTWVEGIHACEDFGDLVSVQSPLRVMLRHVGSVSRPQHSSQVQARFYGPVSVSTPRTTGSADCNKIGKVVIFFRFLFILLHCQI